MWSLLIALRTTIVPDVTILKAIFSRDPILRIHLEPRHLSLAACVVCFLWSVQALAQQEPEGLDAQEAQASPAPEEAPPEGVDLTDSERKLLRPFIDESTLDDSVGWQLGPSFNGLFSSGQGRPFAYPALGWRYKHDGMYVDVTAPAAFAALDALQYFFQGELVDDPFNLFQSINGALQLFYVEALHARVGGTYAVRLFKTDEDEGVPVTLTYGLVGYADWVIFDAVFLGAPPEDLGDIEQNISLDPVVVGPGGFVGLLWRVSHVTVDVALEVGRDLVEVSAYVPQSGWMLGASMDLNIRILDKFGMFFHPRYTVYTHVPDRWLKTMAVHSGVILSF